MVILVVDDNEDYRGNIVEILQLEGYQVIEASDGKEALDLLQSYMVKLVISDLDMPNLDGQGLLTAVKSDNRTKKIPVFIMSADVGQQAKRRLLKLDAQGFFYKPVQIDTMLNGIAGYLTDDIMPG